MTFDKIINRVYLGVQRDDLKPDYPDFINEACREVQKDRDWSFMHNLEDVVIPNGQRETYLPNNFKTFEGEPPVFLKQAGNFPQRRQHRCKVIHRSQFERQYSYGTASSLFHRNGPEFPLWYDTINDRAIIGTHANALGDLTLIVSFFGWLPTLRNPGDENYLTKHHELLIIAKAKAVALASVNDPLAQGFEQEAAMRFRTAANNDEKERLAQLRVRIGG